MGLGHGDCLNNCAYYNFAMVMFAFCSDNTLDTNIMPQTTR